jgi:hypothetical protein
MKWHTQQATLTHYDWAHTGTLVGEGCRAAKSSCLPDIESAADARRQASGNLTGPLRIVTILAFCQTLFFLVLFLFICAWAGAATSEKPATNLELIASTYAPQKDRDPFGSGSVESADASAKAAASIESGMLKLNGLLYDRVHPSAIVNNQLVELNKPVTVQTEKGGVEVKALEITREIVLLEIGGRKVELRLGGREPEKAAK